VDRSSDDGFGGPTPILPSALKGIDKDGLICGLNRSAKKE